MTRPGLSPEEFIAYCARVSNPGNQASTETSDRLISYLIRNRHWSPFEMASATMEIVTTRDIARQILRHRSFSFQEFSQRYANANELGCIDNRQARWQDLKNRQNSIVPSKEEISPIELAFERMQREANTTAWSNYNEAIALGIAKEQARVFLPEGLTISRLYMAGSIRSWIHYIDLRTGNGTQAEHREVAENCRKALAEHYPVIFGKIDESKN